MQRRNEDSQQGSRQQNQQSDQQSQQARDRQPAAWSFVIDLLPEAEQFDAWSMDETPFGEAARLYRADRREPAAMSPQEPNFRRIHGQATQLTHSGIGR